MTTILIDHIDSTNMLNDDVKSIIKKYIPYYRIIKKKEAIIFNNHLKHNILVLHGNIINIPLFNLVYIFKNKIALIAFDTGINYYKYITVYEQKR